MLVSRLQHYEVDKKTMIRNRYNRIRHPPQTPNGKGTRTTKTALKFKQHKCKAKGTAFYINGPRKINL